MMIPMYKLKALLALLLKGKTQGISNKELKKLLPEIYPGDKRGTK